MKYPAWAAFVAANQARIINLSSGMVKSWIKGIARPPVNRVPTVALAMRLPESVILLHAGHGEHGSAAEILERRREEKNRKTGDYVKSRYREDANFRDRMRAGTREYDASSAPVERFVRIMRAAILDTPRLRRRRNPSLPLHPDKESRLAKAKAREYRKARQARNSPGHFTAAEWLERMREFGHVCAYCGISRSDAMARGYDLETDHIVSKAVVGRVPALAPFANSKIANVVPACKSCNASKGETWTLSWARSKGITMHPIAQCAVDRIMARVGDRATAAEMTWLLSG